LLAEFRKLLDEVDEYRRDDTFRLIDAICQSTDRWLAHPVPGRPWIAGYDFDSLGPDGLDEVRRIWGRDSTMWGARLDDDDRRALAEDLAGSLARDDSTAGEANPSAETPEAPETTEPPEAPAETEPEAEPRAEAAT
jgi:hypothetical protein